MKYTCYELGEDGFARMSGAQVGTKEEVGKWMADSRGAVSVGEDALLSFEEFATPFGDAGIFVCPNGERAYLGTCKD